MTRFRVTERCLTQDLGVPAEHLKRDVRYMGEIHEALRTFYMKRCAEPCTGENMLNVAAYPNVKTLHVGRGRGVTFHDHELDICWLLAYSPKHSKGSRDDAYKHFERLDERKELMPSASDVLLTTSVSSAELIDALTALGSELYKQAKATPGIEVGDTIAVSNDVQADVVLAIEVYIDGSDRAEECTVAFTVPPGEDFGAEQALDVVAALVPIEVPIDSVEYATSINGRPIRHSELAFRWAVFSS